MKWRRIDNMRTARYIKHIQKQIASGDLVLSPVATAAEFNVWRVHMLDRMIGESAHNNWVDEGRTRYDLATELEEDVLYYDALQEKRKEV
jgi:hypothetical protein